MGSLKPREDKREENPSSLPAQARSFFMHSGLALCAWSLFMLAGYILNPPLASQSLILALSGLIPLVAGYIVNRIRQDEMATAIWLLGLIWVLVVSLWILDMPTGPDSCFHCDATQKLLRTFLSIPSPSGLIDNDGPFLGTWPAAALAGYAIGARLAYRRPRKIAD